MRHGKMDTLGFEPRACRMRSGCDTTTPCALDDVHDASLYKNLNCYAHGGISARVTGAGGLYDAAMRNAVILTHFAGLALAYVDRIVSMLTQ